MRRNRRHSGSIQADAAAGDEGDGEDQLAAAELWREGVSSKEEDDSDGREGERGPRVPIYGPERQQCA